MKKKRADRKPVRNSRRNFLLASAGAPALALAGRCLPAVAEVLPAETENDVRRKDAGDPSYKAWTLTEVNQTGYEVSYKEIADAYGGPMSLGPVISVKAHPELIWVRPDMGIGIVANPVAFAIGSVPSLIPWRGMERSLKRGYLPIVYSRITGGKVVLEQEAYATLLDAGEVRNGYEKQVAIVRMAMFNAHPTETHAAAFWAFLRTEIKTTGHYPSRLFGDYELFDVVGSLPRVSNQLPGSNHGLLQVGSTILGVYELGPGVKVSRYKNALKCEMKLLPGQRKNVNFKISTNINGFNEAEIDKLRRLDFFDCRDQREIDLEKILSRGTSFSVPEEPLNSIYKAQILYNQTQMVQAADRDYYMPVQGSVGFWPWEQMKQLVSLDALGFHDDVRKSLEYFLKLQGTRPPDGMTTGDYEGVFASSGTFEKSGWGHDTASTIYGQIAEGWRKPGADFMNWVSNTGAGLYAFAEHYFYSNDAEWLQRVAPALIKACNWIIHERQKTKLRDANGQKVLYYGLMPTGRATDMKTHGHDLCFTDGYTYQGLQRVADALADVKHPESERLLKEAKNYRDDILEVMRRTKRSNPDLSPYPERLSQPDDWTVYATGPSALIDTGLLEPRDPVFPQLENYLIKHTNRGVLGLMGRATPDDKIVPGSYYMVTGEDLYHYALLVRGEVPKALLTFYSALSFGVDKQSLGPVERFSLYDQRYAPFFIDSSGGMRLCGMIRRALLLEVDTARMGEEPLRLLAGAPRRWFESGNRIEVQNAHAYFGTFDLKVDSQVDNKTIIAEIVLRKVRAERLRGLRLRLPHPRNEPVERVTVNGREWKAFNSEQETIDLVPNENRYRIVAYY